MTLWERIKALLEREAADIKDGMTAVGRSLDETLARKERELEATPSERFDMILEDIAEDEARLAELEETVANQPEAVPQLRKAPTHQLLDRTDVLESSHLDRALAAVRVDFVSIDDSPHTHEVTIDQAELPEAFDLDRVAADLAEHVLVTGTVVRPGARIMAAAPTLHVEDVRLLAASALARQLDD